jgi:methionyl-tRNA formyltransferase
VDKLVLFTDDTAFVSLRLLRATLQAVQCRNDVAVTAVCTRAPLRQYGRLYWRARIMLGETIQSFFDPSRRQTYKALRPLDAIRIARQHRFEVLVPPDQNVNHPQFIEALKTRLKPTIAFSFYCLQRFSPALLDIFECVVNYHNGHLPDYRGWQATSWSIYHGDRETGFTFHQMSPGIDEGDVLIKGGVPTRPDASWLDLEREKAVAAIECLPRLIDILVKRQNGEPQTGTARYFSQKDYLDITRISDPSRHSSAELMKRLQAFDLLLMRINGRWYRVTKLQKVSARSKVRKGLSFRAADGIVMQPTRFRYLPFHLYRIMRWVAPNT